MRAIPIHATQARLVALLAILVALLLPSGRAASAQVEQPAGRWGPPFLTVVQTGPPVSEAGLLLQWTVPYEGVPAEVTVFRLDPFVKKVGPTEGISGPGFFLNTDVEPGQEYRYQVRIVYKQDDTESPPFDSNIVAATFSNSPTQAAPATPPIVSGATPYQTDVDVRWHTVPKYDYDRLVVRYRVKPTDAKPNPAFGHVEHDGGHEGSTRVSGLVPRTTYMFSVRGCYDVVFGIGGEDCTDYGTEYEVTTLPLQSMATRDPLVIQSSEARETWVALSWTAPRDFGYATYIVSHREKAGPGAAVTEAVSGTTPGHTVHDLKPSTSYVFQVRGCDFDLGLYDPSNLNAIGTPGMTCDAFGPEYEARTHAPPAGTFGSAGISLSQPTVTAGNSVEVKGSVWRENIGTPVKLTLSGAGGAVQLGSTKVDRGTFTATVTIPAATKPGSYTVLAESAGAKAQATLEVIAPSRTGKLTVTWGGSGEVTTDIEANVGPFFLSGANFAPGPLTIYVDSPGGAQIGTATVASNGTFRKEFRIQPSDIGGKYGPHKLVVVQNGAVTGEINVTVMREYIIR